MLSVTCRKVRQDLPGRSHNLKEKTHRRTQYLLALQEILLEHTRLRDGRLFVVVFYVSRGEEETVRGRPRSTHRPPKQGIFYPH